MARLKQEIVAEREQFLMALFHTDPNISIAKANEKLKAKYGANMRLNRAYELREEVRKSMGITNGKHAGNGHADKQQPQQPTIVAAKSQEGASEVKPAVVIPANKTLADAISALNNLGITHLISEMVMGGKYMIVAPA